MKVILLEIKVDNRSLESIKFNDRLSKHFLLGKADKDDRCRDSAYYISDILLLYYTASSILALHQNILFVICLSDRSEDTKILASSIVLEGFKAA